jgi:hypothetical protein
MGHGSLVVIEWKYLESYGPESVCRRDACLESP